MSLNSLLFCAYNRQGSSKYSSTMPSKRNLISHWCNLIILQSCALLEYFNIKEATPNYKLCVPTNSNRLLSCCVFFRLYFLGSLQLIRNVAWYQYSHSEYFDRNTPKLLVKFLFAINLSKNSKIVCTAGYLAACYLEMKLSICWNMCCRDVSHRSLKCYPAKVSERWR